MSDYVKKSEIPALVKEAIAEIFGIVKDTPKRLPTKQAFKELGYLTKPQLLNKVKTGFYRLGIEVEDRRSKNSMRPLYYFDIAACKKRDKQLPEKRI